MNPTTGIAIIVPLVGFLLIVWHDRHKKFVVQSDTFRQTLLHAMKEIESDPGSFRMVLNNEFGKHADAAFAFKQHLERRQLKRFNHAWREYEEYTNAQVRDVPIFVMIGTEVSPNDPTDTLSIANQRKYECLHHFNTLLSFTKNK